MKYMIMTFGKQAAWEDLGLSGNRATLPEAQVTEHFRSLNAYYDDLRASGEWFGGLGLADASHAVTVDILDGQPVVAVRPYAAEHEALGGFVVVDVTSRERAVEIAARFAGLILNRVELRPVVDDAGQDLSIGG